MDPLEFRLNNLKDAISYVARMAEVDRVKGRVRVNRVVCA
jgi:hypothetical protein